jgi:hypothetical protein
LAQSFQSQCASGIYSKLPSLVRDNNSSCVHFSVRIHRRARQGAKVLLVATGLDDEQFTVNASLATDYLNQIASALR